MGRDDSSRSSSSSSKSRHRDRDDHKHRSSHSSSSSRRDKSKSGRDAEPEEEAVEEQKDDVAQGESISELQKAQELLMKKRQERLAKWQAEQQQAAEAGQGDENEDDDDDEQEGPQKGNSDNAINNNNGNKRAAGVNDEDGDDGEANGGGEIAAAAAKRQRRTQSLDELEDDDDAMDVNGKDGSTAQPQSSASAPATVSAASAPAEEDEEEDPLDQFMKVNEKEVEAVKKEDAKKMKARVTEFAEGDDDDNDGGDDDDDDDRIPKPKEAKPEEKEYWSGFKPKAKKDLAVVDHSKIQYNDFQKKFYHESPEIARMSEEEVAALRFDLGNIKVKGKEAPRPVKTWSQCVAHRAILDTIKKFNFASPTPIQAQALPAIMSGRDLIGIAKTGSGKTLAFVIPMLRHVLDQPRVAVNEGPIALLMVPTRELATQTYNEIKKFCRTLPLRVACVYGGTSISEQIAELKRGAEIIVCTPGRMIDMLIANNGKVTNTQRVTFVVLDEADRMFDMGFEPQVMRILDNVRPDRQTVMFSATFPRQMETLARRILKHPVEVQVGGRSVVSETVEQHTLVINQEERFLKLLELLGLFYTQGSVLVFVERQTTADTLLRDLLQAGYPCLALHGQMDQEDRQSHIKDFKDGIVKLLVATSVAARGLDVKQLILVVNYDCPNHYEDYVHRCGRTGRAGNKGTAYTFITPDQADLSGDIIKALELSGTPAPPELNALWDEYVRTHKQAKKSSGFGGKGYKFDELEALKQNEMKMLTMKAHTMGDENDEDDEEKEKLQELNDEIEERVAAILGGKKNADAEKQRGPLALTMGEQPGKAGSKATPAAAASSAATSSAVPLLPTLSVAPAGGASGEAAAASADGGEGAGDSFSSLSFAQLPVGPVSSKEELMLKMVEVMRRVRDLNDRLGFTTQAPGQQTAEAGKQKPEGSFEGEVEINDFPPEARARVTRKDHVAEIVEYSGCAITIRGSFFPPGKKPKEGDRKLYVFIEGKTQQIVDKAKAHIESILREELHRQATTYTTQNNRAAGGRYKVLAITGK
eukprot:m.168720 g.168720  ORF g.168720 m.168720 type:complete len:1042 (+) comp17223_c0_seq1:2720-5845(+)